MLDVCFWFEPFCGVIFFVVYMIKICFIFIRKGWTVSFQYLCSLLLDVMKDNRFVPACKVSIFVFDGLIMFEFDQ